MSYNTKNYTEHGGEKTVIGGTLEIKEGAEVIGSAVTPAEHQADSTADEMSELVNDFNTLIAKLINAGLMRSS